jgi:hypothetical protein
MTEDDETARLLAELLGPPLQRAADELIELLREAEETGSDANTGPTSEG